MIIVGYERGTYAEKRLFLCSRKARYTFVRRNAEAAYPSFFNEEERACSSSLSCPDVHLMHYFNQINFGRTPFVTSFESIVPRYFTEQAFALGVKILAKDTCRKLLALSRSTLDMQAAKLQRTVPSRDYDRIMQKTEVLHAPQTLLEHDPARFAAPGARRFLFIGGDFFRKGGDAVLRAFQNLRREHDTLFLTLVSALDWSNSFAHVSKNDCAAVIRYIEDNREWVTWHNGLTNEEVLRLIPEHHAGLLPSFREPYGYSVLEMQAGGLPVITTNIRAFPELNDDDSGWRIELPGGREIPCDCCREQFEEATATLQREIEAIIRRILREPDLLTRKSEAARARIAARHSPERYAQTLTAIYEATLQ